MVRAIRLLPMMSVDRWALRVSAMPMPGGTQAVVGEGLVHLRALQHKGQLLLAGGVRQLPELGDGHGLELGVKRVLAAGGVLLLKEHLVVGAGVDDVGVGVPDGADADAPGGDDLGVGVEPALPLGDGHAHLLVLHQTDGLLADDAVDLLQQRQPLLRVAQAGTQGGGITSGPPAGSRGCPRSCRSCRCRG